MPRGVKRYDEVLEYLENYFRTHGRMPTMKHAAYEVGIGRGGLARALQGLVREGKLSHSYVMPYKFKS